MDICINIISLFSNDKNNLELDELCTFWFTNPNLWFNASKDNDLLIKNKYNNLVEKEIDNKNSSLGLIILYDQIVRHIFRDDINKKEKIQYYLNIALEHVKNILPNIESYKPEERCFILLPLRHTFDKTNIQLCLSYVNNWSNNKENDNPIYNRFYQASVTSLVKLNESNDIYYHNINNNNNYSLILDPKSIQQIKFNYNEDVYSDPIYLEFSKNLNNNINNNLVISISGGVDSMVCSFLLYYYCKKNKNSNTSFTNKPKAITINYSNRVEQSIEIDMVNEWLQLMDIEHYVKVITEITRPMDKNRDFYEKITRDIRFNAYKKICSNNNTININSSVILGHNKDDALENILSNIKKKKSYDNLHGMQINSKEKDVNIIRPLLNISKKDILDFANKYSIPFTFDSTPSWSERGRMRDILIPQIKEFDKDILDGLIELSNNFTKIYKIYKNNLILNENNIIYEKDKCFIEYQNILFFDYWKNIINIICKHYNCKMIKNKSITNLINNINYGNRITLSKNIICKLHNKQIIFYIK